MKSTNILKLDFSTVTTSPDRFCALSGEIEAAERLNPDLLPRYAHRWRFLLSLAIFLLAITVEALAQSQSPAEAAPAGSNSGIWQSVTVALIGALAGAVAKYIADYISERRKPRQQISYEIASDKALSLLRKEMQKDARIFFQDVEVKNLYQVSCLIRNTGKATVRKQSIRFSFPTNVKILNFLINPQPEPELGLEKSTLGSDWRVHFDHFPPGKELTFSFTVDGEQPKLTLHATNEKDEVEFIEKGARQHQQDEDVLKRFFYFSALILLLPEAAGVIPFDVLAGPAASAIRIVLLFPLLPLLAPASMVLARRLLASPEDPKGSIHIEGSSYDSVLIAGDDNVVRLNIDRLKDTSIIDSPIGPESIETSEPPRPLGPPPSK